MIELGAIALTTPRNLMSHVAHQGAVSLMRTAFYTMHLGLW